MNFFVLDVVLSSPTNPNRTLTVREVVEVESADDAVRAIREEYPGLNIVSYKIITAVLD